MIERAISSSKTQEAFRWQTRFPPEVTFPPVPPLHELRLRTKVGSTKNLPPCPSCQNGRYNTVRGGDAAEDPYPQQS
jgi:hypothetical protein